MKHYTFFISFNGEDEANIVQSNQEEKDVGKKKSIINSKEILISPETIKVHNQHDNIATNVFKHLIMPSETADSKNVLLSFPEK